MTQELSEAQVEKNLSLCLYLQCAITIQVTPVDKIPEDPEDVAGAAASMNLLQ